MPTPVQQSSWWHRENHADRRPFLLARGRIKAALRGWFEAQGFVEVETSALQVSPGNETHLHALHTTLAALFLIGGVALAIESWFGGWGLGLILALATVNGGAFVVLAMLFAATAIHLRRSGIA